MCGQINIISNIKPDAIIKYTRCHASIHFPDHGDQVKYCDSYYPYTIINSEAQF